MIDWVTARRALDTFSNDEQAALRSFGDRILRVTPSGEVVYEIAAWDSIRSDSHQVVVRVGGSDVWVQGSPARCCGDGDTVFGSGPSASMDLCGSLQRMVAVGGVGVKGLGFGHAGLWSVSRVDVTQSICLPDSHSVLAALDSIRGSQGGRFRVSATSGSTVYHGGKSRLRRGKAYAKGQHIRYMQRSRNYDGRVYNEQEMCMADRLLRLEVSLGAQWWRRMLSEGVNWWDVSPGLLIEAWRTFYEPILGSGGVMGMSVVDRISGVDCTDGARRAALGAWALISSVGWEDAQRCYPRSSWYRHVRILRAAGLGGVDFGTPVVVESILQYPVVASWESLKVAA